MPAPTTTRPEAIPPRAPAPTTKRADDHDDRLRYATRHDAPDDYCHWLVSRARTLCGQTRNPPLARQDMHKAAPCPNGNPPCPECVRIAGQRGVVMTAPVQLAFPADARRDELTPAEIAGVEARIAHDDAIRSRHATPAPRCRCRRPWSEDGETCWKCGREIR